MVDPQAGSSGHSGRFLDCSRRSSGPSCSNLTGQTLSLFLFLTILHLGGRGSENEK